jgi:hypothetical protein
MFDGKAVDFLRTGQFGDVAFTSADHVISVADVRAAGHGPASQALHVVSCILIARPPPPRETSPRRTSHGKRNQQTGKDRVCLCRNGCRPR